MRGYFFYRCRLCAEEFKVDGPEEHTPEQVVKILLDSLKPERWQLATDYIVLMFAVHHCPRRNDGEWSTINDKGVGELIGFRETDQ